MENPSELILDHTYEPAGTSVGARAGDVDAYESLKARNSL